MVGVMYKCVHVDVDVCKGDFYLAAAVGDNGFVTTLVSIRVVNVAAAALLSAAVLVDAVHVSEYVTVRPAVIGGVVSPIRE